MKLFHLHEDANNIPVRELDLDVRSTNVFKANGIEYAGDIMKLGVDGMHHLKNMGMTSIIYVCKQMRKIGLEVPGAAEAIAEREFEENNRPLSQDSLREYLILCRKALDMGFNEEIYKMLDNEAIRLFGRSTYECIAARNCVACGMSSDADEVFMLTGLCWHHRHTEKFPGRPKLSLE